VRSETVLVPAETRWLQRGKQGARTTRGRAAKSPAAEPYGSPRGLNVEAVRIRFTGRGDGIGRLIRDLATGFGQRVHQLLKSVAFKLAYPFTG
jgi:hypothetical protein